MSIRVPIANTNNVMARNFVSKMASDGFLPVIALEAFVEGGRTYQAYKRGGFDEARENGNLRFFATCLLINKQSIIHMQFITIFK